MLLYHLAQLKSQDKNTSLFQETQPSSAFNASISSCHIQQDLSSFSLGKLTLINWDGLWAAATVVLQAMGRPWCKQGDVLHQHRRELSLALQQVWWCRSLGGFARGEMGAGIQTSKPLLCKLPQASQGQLGAAQLPSWYLEWQPHCQPHFQFPHPLLYQWQALWSVLAARPAQAPAGLMWHKPVNPEVCFIQGLEKNNEVNLSPSCLTAAFLTAPLTSASVLKITFLKIKGCL